MAGEHDDRHIGIGVGAGLADHLRQFQAVEDRHHPVGEDDIRHVMGEGFETGGAVFGFIDFARAEAVQQRAQDPPHMRVVVDDEKTQAIEVDADHTDLRRGGRQNAYLAVLKRKELSLRRG